MPRQLSVPSREYAPGTYGPYSLDSFTQNDTERIEFTLTVESWPTDVEYLATATIEHNGGGKMVVNVPNMPKDADGNPVATFAPWLGLVSDTVDGVTSKRNANSATITVVVHRAFRTTITMGAV